MKCGQQSKVKAACFVGKSQKAEGRSAVEVCMQNADWILGRL